MANDPKTPERFAKIILSELADIHALVLGLADNQIVYISTRSEVPTDDATVKRLTEVCELKRIERAKTIYADLLKKLDLPG